MSCNCSKALPIPKCLDTLILGDVADGSQSYLVYFKTPDGRVDVYPSVDVVYTDLIGVSDIDVRIGTQYEVWLTLATSNSINDRVSFTPIGATVSVTCIEVSFMICDTEFTYQQIELE